MKKNIFSLLVYGLNINFSLSEETKMKKLKPAIAIIIFIMFSNITVLSQTGIKGGVNLSNYYGNGANDGGNEHDTFLGVNLGYFKDWYLGKVTSDKKYFFSLGFETNISVKGSVIRNIITYSETNPNEIWDISDRKKFIYYLESPLLIKFHYSAFQDFQAQVYLGGMLSLAIVDVTKTIKHSNPAYSFNNTHFFFSSTLGESPSFTDFSVISGFGVSYKKFILDIRYAKGLIKIYPETSLYSISFPTGYFLSK